MTLGQFMAVVATMACASALVVALVPGARDHVRRWGLVYAAVTLAWVVALFRKGDKRDESVAPNPSKQTGALDNIAAAGASRDAQSEQRMAATIASAEAEASSSAAAIVEVEEIEDTDERLRALSNLVNGGR
jgi:hypothetical protein